MKRLLALLTSTTQAKNKLQAALTPADAPAFIDACASLAQLGWTAEDVEKISHAMVNRRILAFGWGQVTDLGEYGTPGIQGGATRGSRPYERAAL